MKRSILLLLIALCAFACTVPAKEAHKSVSLQNQTESFPSPAPAKKAAVAKTKSKTTPVAAAVVQPTLLPSAAPPEFAPTAMPTAAPATAIITAPTFPTEKVEPARNEVIAEVSKTIEEPPTIANTALPLFAPTASAKTLKLSGRMQIDFKSRLEPDQYDVYRLDLECADSLQVSGKVIRKPRVLSKVLAREEKPQQFEYDLQFMLRNSAQQGANTEAGKWTGILNYAKDGTYFPSQLKITSALNPGNGSSSGLFSGKFAGQVQGSSGFLGALRDYTRIMGGKKLVLGARKVDPLKFIGLSIAPGPLHSYPAAHISGNLDYDYDTGNWLTNGIEISYVSGERDRITGSIKWIEDKNRSINGKGQYQFNLRFNEDRFAAAQGEESFFESVSDEEAFFLVDESVPTLGGTIKYVDKLGPLQADGEPQVFASNIQYELVGHHLSERQIATFLKLWLLIIGPVNDE